MPKDRGYIKLHRSLLDSEVWKLPEAHKCVWIALLMRACYEPQNIWLGNKRIAISPGTAVIGIDGFAEVCGVAPNTVRSALKNLEKLKMVQISRSNYNTLVKITNWLKFQVEKANGVQPLKVGPSTSPSTIEGFVEPIEESKRNKEYINGSSKKKKPKASSIPDACAPLLASYNKWAGQAGWAEAKRMNRQRVTRMKALLKEQPLEFWEKIFETWARNKFYSGENDSGWKITLDWVLKEKTLTNVLEGRYESRRLESAGLGKPKQLEDIV